MKDEMNNKPNQSSENQDFNLKQKSTVARWIISGFFAMFVLVNGFHYSSLFLLCAAFLMLPLPFIDAFLQKQNIKPIVVIILSVVLFFIGVITSPPSESTYSPSDDTIQGTTDPSENQSNDFTKPDNSTSSNTSNPNDAASGGNSITESSDTTPDDNDAAKTPDDTTANDNDTISPDNAKPSDSNTNTDDTTVDNEKVTMVWISSSGSKYHSKSSCSNMKSPTQISLEDAQKQGYEPCKRCH